MGLTSVLVDVAWVLSDFHIKRRKMTVVPKVEILFSGQGSLWQVPHVPSSLMSRCCMDLTRPHRTQEKCLENPVFRPGLAVSGIRTHSTFNQPRFSACANPCDPVFPRGPAGGGSVTALYTSSYKLVYLILLTFQNVCLTCTKLSLNLYFPCFFF